MLIKKLDHNSFQTVAVLLQIRQVFLEVSEAHVQKAGKIVLDLLVESLEARRCHLLLIFTSWSHRFELLDWCGFLVEEVCEGLGDAVVGRDHRLRVVDEMFVWDLREQDSILILLLVLVLDVLNDGLLVNGIFWCLDLEVDPEFLAELGLSGGVDQSVECEVVPDLFWGRKGGLHGDCRVCWDRRG